MSACCQIVRGKLYSEDGVSQLTGWKASFLSNPNDLLIALFKLLLKRALI